MASLRQTLRPLARQTFRRPSPRVSLIQSRQASTPSDDPNVTDPGMNGGYVNPPAQKRALRDPYGDWWDKQERRNFGEPVHEDNDLLAVFSTEPYTHASPGKAGLHFMMAAATMLGFVAVAYQFYPDRPSAPRTFPSGLEAELGGKGAVRAPAPGEEEELLGVGDHKSSISQ